MSASGVRETLVTESRALIDELDLQGFSAPFSFFPDETIDSLVTYIELLKKWTGKVDLVSVAPSGELVRRHIIDSLAAAIVLHSAFENQTGNILDVGSGAGLPGIPLALFWPERHVTLCEPREKRVMFLKELTRALQIDHLVIHRGRIERFQHDEPFTLSLCRGFSNHRSFFEASEKHLEQNGIACIMGGPSTEVPRELSGVEQCFYRLFGGDTERQLLIRRSRIQ